MPGYYALFDNTTGTVRAQVCGDGLCAGACAAEVSVANCSAQLMAIRAEPFACDPAPSDDDPMFVSGYCSVRNGCAGGRTGFLCGACMEGYSEWEGRCVGTAFLRCLCFFIAYRGVDVVQSAPGHRLASLPRW
jgi:hypothetical protein